MIGGIDNKGDLNRHLERKVPELARAPSALVLPELPADPDAPGVGAVAYCIADNGLGKRAWRVRFPTGAIQTVATEP